MKKFQDDVELTEDEFHTFNLETKDVEDGLKECTYTMKLPCGRHKDTGQYKFTAVNKFGDDECNARLDILLVPEIDGLKDSQRIPYEDIEFEITGDVEKEIYKLYISDIGLGDDGMYTVTATNSRGESSQTAKFHVHTEVPSFVKDIEDQTIKDYDDAEYRVRVNGVPKPHIKFKDGKELKTQDRMTIETDSEVMVSSFMGIKHFNESDVGKYSCTASNLVGQAETIANLIMAQIAPSFGRPVDRAIEVDEGDELEIKTKLDGSPIPTVKWYKDGEELPDSEHVKLTALPDGSIRLYIDKVVPLDCGAYKIVAKNKNGEASTICAVAVKPNNRKPVFVKPLEDTKAVVGQPLKLEAQIMAFPAPEIKWFKDGHPPGGIIGLHLDTVRPEDAGNYTVTIANRLGDIKGSAKVSVEAREKKPTFQASLQPLSVVEGFPAKLEVKVVGHPPPTLKTHNGKEIVPDGKSVKIVTLPDGTTTLVLEKARPEDAGDYEVTATNDKGSVSSKARLDVTGKGKGDAPEEKPVFVHGLRDTTTEEGDILILGAPFLGNPIPDVTWTKDGEPVGLEIKPAKLSDAGNYTCRLKNILGEDESTAKAAVRKVFQAPNFTQRFTDLQQLPTFDAKFPARITGVPHPDISWYFNDKLINLGPGGEGEKYRLKRDGDAVCLYVKECKPEDTGRYKCKAINCDGEASCEANLDVVDKIEKKQKIEPPEFLKKIGDCEVYKGMTAKFTACASGFPEPEFEWFRDGEKLYPSDRIRMEREGSGLLRLSIENVVPSDVAKYKLRIFNPHGEASCEAGLNYDSLESKPKRPVGDLYTDFDKFRKTGAPLPLADRPIISRMTDRRLTLSWKPSIPIGPRIPVTYRVEMSEQPDGDWFTARTGVRSCACDIHNLEPFRDYKFRVRVENKYGVSDPSPFAITYREKLEPEPPKFFPYLAPGIDFRPETSPYFPKDFDIEKPPHDGYAQAPRFLRQEHDTQYGVKNHNCNLFWFVYGYPKPKMTYYFNDELIESGGRYDTSYTRNGQATLFINRMLDRDVGNYEAVATNEHGEARQRVKLEIAEYPEFIKRPDEIIIMTRKSGRIDAKIQFIEPDTSILQINDAITKDEGLYSLSARNIAGTVSCSVMVHIEESESEYGYLTYSKGRNIKPKDKLFDEYYDIGRNYAAKIMHGKSDLRPFMKNELEFLNTWITETEIAGYIRQILWGLEHMHIQNIAHLGLTIGDLLISHPGGDDLKIGDLGLARRLAFGKLASLEYGMPEFVAPEVVNGDGVGLGADMWSVGIITYLLLSGISPFRGENDRETLTRIKEGGKYEFHEKWFSSISAEAKDFISQLLVMDIKTALKHPWLGAADKIPVDQYKISTENLKNYYSKYRDWYHNASCRTWFRRKPLAGAFTHPSKMVYPPGQVYTPEPTPEPKGKEPREPRTWEDQTPIIRERRRFTDVMDEEIDDERRERINQYGSSEVYSLRRLRRELGTRLDGHAEAEALIEYKREGQPPFFREKPQLLPIVDDQPCELVCYAVGDPKPSVQWFKNDLVVTESHRVKINEDDEGRSILRFEPASNVDVGIYKVVARNKVGQTQARTRLVLASVPSAPDSPEAAEISDTEVLLKWKQPKDDGNSQVLCYSLQYKETDNVDWIDVANNIDHEFYVVRNLRPNVCHHFRLAARNRIGWRRFSVVAKGIEKASDRVIVAKVLELKPETEAQVNREFEVLRSLRHERIATLLAAYKPTGAIIAVLVQEKLQGADVLTYFSSRHEYTEQMVAQVVTQILDGLQYLHWRGYCHLDIQPDNIVMSTVRSVQVKLVDFGLAQRVSKLGTIVDKAGEVEFSAPEVLNNEPAFPQTDIWSLGVVTYILLSGVSPFRGADSEETRQNVTFVRYRFEHLYKELTQEATRFLMLVFKRSPGKRPTAEESHEHRWLLPSEFMVKKRDRAVFLGNRLKDYTEDYHARRAQEATKAELSGAFGGQKMVRSHSVQEELFTTF
ncbi:hypothetical protein C0J52_03611 [Blattella germanica]|nr:hypothetical protein C0J52_03611 [Blattella germanica]